MKQLLTLCTKKVHFIYNGVLYQQNDGVAMESHLGPVLAGVFMTERGNNLIPTLSDDITF